MPVMATAYRAPCSMENAVNCSFVFFLLSIWFILSAKADQVSDKQKIQELDAKIQSYAFKALAPVPKTGRIYNVSIPGLDGIKVQAVRLRTGSLKRHGVEINEFSIPTFVIADTTKKYVVLVYREFNNYTTYTPEGYTLVAPVLGIKAYEGNDLNTTQELPEISVNSGGDLISARIPFSMGNLQASTLYCATFDSDAKLTLSNVSSSPNVCFLNKLVDCSLVVSSMAPAPSPSLAPQGSKMPSPAPANGPISISNGNAHKKKSSRIWKLAVGWTIGCLAILVLIILAALVLKAVVHRARIAQMEAKAANSETLQTALIGGNRAPAAANTRTKPVLETDYSVS